MRNSYGILLFTCLTIILSGLATADTPETRTATLKPSARTDEWPNLTLDPQEMAIYNVNMEDGNLNGVAYELRTPVPAPSMQPGYSVFALWAWRQTGSSDNSFVFEVVNTVWEEKTATVKASCWWDPAAGEGSGNGEGEAPGPIDGWAKGIANHLEGHLKVTDLAILDPPDYLCINESLDLSAWVMRPENFPWDFLEPVDVDWEVTPNGSGTFVPSDGHSVTFTPDQTGDVTITATVPGTDGPITESVTITVIKVEIESFLAEPGSEPGDTETVVLGYDDGRVTYRIEPNGFTADTAELKIKNKNDVLVFRKDLTGKTGGVTYTYDWDGKWNQSPNDNPAIYAKPDNGPYKALIAITKGTVSCDSNEDTVKMKGKAIVESIFSTHSATMQTKLLSLGFDAVHVDNPPSKANAVAEASLRLIFYVIAHGSYSASEYFGPELPDGDNILHHTDLPASLAYEVVFMNCCNSNLNPNRNNFITKFGARAYIGWEGSPWNVNAVSAANAFMDGLLEDMRVYHAYLAAYEDYILDSARLRFTGDGTKKLKLK